MMRRTNGGGGGVDLNGESSNGEEAAFNGHEGKNPKCDDAESFNGHVRESSKVEGEDFNGHDGKSLEGKDGESLKGQDREAFNGHDRKVSTGQLVLFQKQDVKAKMLFVGTGARLLFYPTLLYNVVRNKMQTEFRWWDRIDQFLLLGAVPFPKDVLCLKDLGVEGVVTLSEPYETLVPSSMFQNQGIKQLVIPTRDYLFAPSFSDIQRAVEFIHENVLEGRTTYVHCKAGRGRSTTIVLCYLIEHRGMSPLEAFRYVQSKRPRIQLAASQWKAVREYGNRKAIVRNEESLEDLPVIVSRLDLEGYGGPQDAGLVGNDLLWRELGRARFLNSRCLIGVSGASAVLARLSCLCLGRPRNAITTTMPLPVLQQAKVEC